MKSRFFAGILAVLLLLVISFAASAEEEESSLWELPTEEMSEESMKNLWETCEPRALALPQEFSAQICSFDVSEDGEVVLALDNHTILVYNSDFVLTNAYRFFSYGSYYCFWEGDHIAVHLVRSDGIIFFSKDLSEHWIARLDGSKEARSFISSLQYKESEQVGGATYSLVQPEGFLGLFAGYEYDQLICTEASGAVKTIYTTGKSYSSSAVFTLAILCLMLLGVLFMVTVTVIIPLWKKKKARRALIPEERKP